MENSASKCAVRVENSVKKISIQYGKLSQKVMFSGRAMLMDEADSPTVSVVIKFLIFSG